MNGGPFESPCAQSFLAELAAGISTGELESTLGASSFLDIELAQEQYALAAVIAEAFSPGHTPQVTDVARAIAAQEHSDTLPGAAREYLNRLLGDPYAIIWQDQSDGGLGMRRSMRALRARLHRVCGP